MIMWGWIIAGILGIGIAGCIIALFVYFINNPLIR